MGEVGVRVVEVGVGEVGERVGEAGEQVGEVGVGRRVRKPGEHQPQRYTLWLMVKEATITKRRGNG